MTDSPQYNRSPQYKRVLLLGCGKMGRAMLEGWLKGGILKSENLLVIEPSAEIRARLAEQGIAAVASTRDAASVKGEDWRADLAVIAVKPQVITDALPPLPQLMAEGGCVLSIAAGIRAETFAGYFGGTVHIVRAMPNTPAAIGRGMIVLFAGPSVPSSLRGQCEALMQVSGQVAWIDDEDLMDAVTAVSGSGPAYVFLMIEAMTEAAVDAGLPEDLAALLARTTVCGAGELAWRSGEDAATLRRNVTSPGGTTAAALDVLMAPDGLTALMKKAVAAAAARSRELAGDS